MNNKLITKKGFTLVELLVVIAIGGILFGLGTAAFQSVTQKGKDAQRKGDVRALRIALEAYFDENGQYPPDGTGQDSMWSSEGDDWIPDLAPTYINKLPKDPRQVGFNIFSNLASIIDKLNGNKNIPVANAAAP